MASTVVAIASARERDLHYDLRTPCRNCPFRRDVPHHEGMPAKLTELFPGLPGGNVAFTCHRTDPRSDWPPARNYKGKLQHCAGFMILMEKEGEPSNGMLRAEKAGRLDRGKLDMKAPVHSMMSILKSYAKWGGALLERRKQGNG